MPKLSDIMRHGGPTLAECYAEPEKYAKVIAELEEQAERLARGMARFWEVRERAARAIEENGNGNV